MLNYIIAYCIIGFVSCMLMYGRAYYKVTLFNKTHYEIKQRIRIFYTIFVYGVFWPIGWIAFLMRVLFTIGIR